MLELQKQKFDNISTKFEGVLGVIDYQKSMLNEQISQSEEKGYITSVKYYEALMKKEKSNISQLEKQRSQMLDSFQEAMKSGKIKEKSEAWYEMVNAINEVTLSIEQANTAMIEYSNSIRQIKWDIFDKIQEKISYITKEADFLISLMENDKLYDDKGQLTNEGQATMGMHGMNYNVYMQQADKYAKELVNLNKELAKDPYNQDVIQRRQELLELQQEMILAAEDEKEVIRDMVSEGIEEELDALQKLIDKRKESLKNSKDLYDFQKKTKQQTEEIAKIQKQLSAYAGDTSEESKSKVQKLTVELADAKQDLEESQYDKYISDQEKLLDDLYSEYETILNQRLDNIDALVEDMISDINANASKINDTIISQANSVGYTLSTEMSNIWNSSTGMNQVISSYGDKLFNCLTSVSSVLGAINSNVQNMISQLNTLANTKINSTPDVSKSPTALKPVTSNTNNSTNSSNNKLNNNDKSTRTDKDYYGVALAIWDGNYGWGTGTDRVTKLKAKGFDVDKIQSIVNKIGNDGYIYSDAWIGKYQGIKSLSPYHYNKFKLGKYNISKDQMAWTQENGISEAIIRPSDGAILTPLKNGDSVLNGKATVNLFDMMNNPSDFIRENLFDGKSVNSVPNINNASNSTSVNLENVNFNLPNVINSDDFIYEMQHNKRFEKLIKSMTVDRAFGGSSLKKYRV